MRRKRSLESLEEAQINLTPLIDVVFVILIMFIVIAPLLETERIVLPPAGEGQLHFPLQAKSPVTLHVYADNHITLNGQEILPIHLKTALQENYLLYPTARPQLFHDSEATFGTYQSVKDALEGAGFTEIDLVLHPGKT